MPYRFTPEQKRAMREQTRRLHDQFYMTHNAVLDVIAARQGQAAADTTTVTQEDPMNRNPKNHRRHQHPEQKSEPQHAPVGKARPVKFANEYRQWTYDTLKDKPMDMKALQAAFIEHFKTGETWTELRVKTIVDSIFKKMEIVEKRDGVYHIVAAPVKESSAPKVAAALKGIKGGKPLSPAPKPNQKKAPKAKKS